MARLKNRNKIIAIEGLPYSGKTTLASSLAAEAAAKGLSISIFKEFSKTSLGRFVESSVETNSYRKWPTATQTFLFLADKCFSSASAQTALTSEVYKIIFDRSFFSVPAFQLGIGSSRRPTIAQVRRFVKACNALASNQIIIPDVVIYLDIEPSICYERGLPLDAFTLEELQRVRYTYLLLAQMYGFKNIDATGTLSSVHSKAISFLDDIQWL